MVGKSQGSMLLGVLWEVKARLRLCLGIKRAISHYLTQCCPSSVTLYGVTTSQWICVSRDDQYELQKNARLSTCKTRPISFEVDYVTCHWYILNQWDRYLHDARKCLRTNTGVFFNQSIFFIGTLAGKVPLFHPTGNAICLSLMSWFIKIVEEWRYFWTTLCRGSGSRSFAIHLCIVLNPRYLGFCFVIKIFP